jgi:DNA-binding NarL/FixJ family response regulator
LGSAGEDERPVVVVDGDGTARRALAGLLADAGFRVIEATTGDEALGIAREDQPCLVVLEIPLGEVSGYEVCRVLREEHGEEVAIIFVSGTRVESYDRLAGLLVGADDYVVKPYAPDELLARVRRLVDRTRSEVSPTLAPLTPRELEVLRLLAEGLSPEDIAEQLVISPKTVASHVEHILLKLKVNSRVQAVALAYREGLVEATSG